MSGEDRANVHRQLVSAATRLMDERKFEESLEVLTRGLTGEERENVTNMFLGDFDHLAEAFSRKCADEKEANMSNGKQLACGTA